MPHIRVIDEDEADGALFEMYDELQRTRGRVSNVMRVQSLHPKAMRRHLDLYMELVYGKGALDRAARELIGIVASQANGCDYGAVHHTDALRAHLKDDSLVEAIVKDWKSADLDPQHKALADYAEGLTLHPATGRKEAVDALRAAGFDDEAILLATEVTSYINFVNRMVHGLGVDLEEDPHQDYNY